MSNILQWSLNYLNLYFFSKILILPNQSLALSTLLHHTGSSVVIKYLIFHYNIVSLWYRDKIIIVSNMQIQTSLHLKQKSGLHIL